MNLKNFKLHPLVYLVTLSTSILFVASSVRHNLFQSNAFDLGIFDNGIYLVSQGKTPYITFRELHILGDHAAFILYFLALFYVIYPTVYWLFFIQAITLSGAVIPIWYLAKLKGLKESQANAIALVYLLYPLIFNVNLFDFHPEVIAIPAIFTAVLAAKLNKRLWFYTAILITLSCKAVLSFTVVGLGIWLSVFEGKKRDGLIVIIIGTIWFLITTQIIIPHFSGKEAAAVERYSFLGDSVAEIAMNLIFKPQIILSNLFTSANLEYLILLFIPILWSISWKSLKSFHYLIPAIPTLFLNLLTDYQPQKDLVHQYSLTIIPFFILMIIDNLKQRKTLFKNNRNILIWSFIAFLCLGKYFYFGTKYLNSLDTKKATKEALTIIETKGNILTTSEFAPHLTHRPQLELAVNGSESKSIDQFDYIFLNKRNFGWGSSPETVNQIIEKAEQKSKFKLVYSKDDIVLFRKK